MIIECPKLPNLQKHLEKNGFYSYLDFDKITENYRKELYSICDSDHKSAFYLPKKWEEISGFGKKRNIIIAELSEYFLRLYNVEIINPKKYTILNNQKFNFLHKTSSTKEELLNNIKKQIDAFIPDENKKKHMDFVLVVAHAINFKKRKNNRYDGLFNNLDKMKGMEP
ncbi:hypothetical protein GF376_02335, partial [Candidatus Peregrinibacteria bacterium]|nr:hypothetical protein [Candidatus Peregrinibacteria bacterium]